MKEFFEDLPLTVIIMLFGWVTFTYVLPIKVVTEKTSTPTTTETYCIKN